MSDVSKPVKILSVRNTDSYVIVDFEDGQQFVYPASILHSAIPRDLTVARRVQESILRHSTRKPDYLH
ncbi:hypothetical protein [Terriglobus roseus]|uniref:KTSC domain-containing protein n=1 Tax=Terriglobus roseus TaxID=392734 RepID=A0A1H4M3B5_9BACT|nr:hypothetical protein [Terriglobus roseus]SEB76995.1 hypothetical protein SAMN05443244_1792 [Terriglobus roseus]